MILGENRGPFQRTFISAWFFQVTVRGSQGHAGTVPMSMRQDPMTAAAELIVLLERLCKHPKDFLSYDGRSDGSTLESLSSSLVCTVGEISSWPSASNVIPGEARNLSLDDGYFLLYSIFCS